MLQIAYNCLFESMREIFLPTKDRFAGIDAKMPSCMERGIQQRRYFLPLEKTQPNRTAVPVSLNYWGSLRRGCHFSSQLMIIACP